MREECSRSLFRVTRAPEARQHLGPLRIREQSFPPRQSAPHSRTELSAPRGNFGSGPKSPFGASSRQVAADYAGRSEAVGPGVPLTERRINYIVKAAANRAGINPAVPVHGLRHAQASHAIDVGAPTR